MINHPSPHTDPVPNCDILNYPLFMFVLATTIPPVSIANLFSNPMRFTRGGIRLVDSLRASMRSIAYSCAVFTTGCELDSAPRLPLVTAEAVRPAARSRSLPPEMNAANHEANRSIERILDDAEALVLLSASDATLVGEIHLSITRYPL